MFDQINKDKHKDKDWLMRYLGQCEEENREEADPAYLDFWEDFAPVTV